MIGSPAFSRRACVRGTIVFHRRSFSGGKPMEAGMGRGLLLWLIGIPFPIIILI
jgi:hypothetical protein